MLCGDALDCDVPFFRQHIDLLSSSAASIAEEVISYRGLVVEVHWDTVLGNSDETWLGRLGRSSYAAGADIFHRLPEFRGKT